VSAVFFVRGYFLLSEWFFLLSEWFFVREWDCVASVPWPLNSHSL
jgi:hypothetical protein